MTDLESLGTDGMEEEYISLLHFYNDLESLFKMSQMIKHVFEVPVLNEYRYFSRALVEYSLARGDAGKKREALAKMSVSLSAGYNDTIDSVVFAIKDSIAMLKSEYPEVNFSKIMQNYNYKAVLESIIEAEKIIFKSRGKRGSRLKLYMHFSQSEFYGTLLEFAYKIPMIEYKFDLESDNSSSERKEGLVRLVDKAFENTEKEMLDQYPYFEMMYQPKYSKEKKIIGAEALVRLYVGPNQKILPDGFMEMVYHIRMSERLDMMVLERVVQDVRELKRRFLLTPSLDISVNVMPETLCGYHYVNKFNDFVHEYDIQGNLSLEIVEEWGEAPDTHMKIHYGLGELDQETRVAIDDFGSGDTKLEYITRVSNLSILKIDREIIDRLDTKNRDKAVEFIRGIVAFAKCNHLSTVAEGVERQAQFDILKEMDGMSYQGYLFSRPVEFSMFCEMLEKQKTE